MRMTRFRREREKRYWVVVTGPPRRSRISTLFTWSTIFLCQLKLRRLTDRGVIPASTFPMPGHPWTSIIGLVFLGLVVVGMAISGWQASPYLSHKVTFLVVVFGIPILAVALAIGWRLVKPAVIENTGDRLKAVWSDDGPTYGPGVSPDDLDVAEHDPATQGRDVFDLNDDGSFVRDRKHDREHDDDGKDSR